MSEKLLTTNRFGITIVKCCASCEHNLGANSDVTRLCNKGEGVVHYQSYCKQWSMKDSLQKAGLGGGKVKKPHYINWVKERLDELAKQFIDPKEKNEIIKGFPAEYVSIYGSRYLK